jgi:hypothetical protein
MMQVGGCVVGPTGAQALSRCCVCVGMWALRTAGLAVTLVLLVVQSRAWPATIMVRHAQRNSLRRPADKMLSLLMAGCLCVWDLSCRMTST